MSELQMYAESPRLRYRLLSECDRDLFCSLFTDAATMRYVGEPLSDRRAARRFDKALRATHGESLNQISVIVERATSLSVGITSLRLIDAERVHAERGLMLLPNACGKHYGFECSVALIDDAFERYALNAIYVFTAPDNKSVERVVVSSGYTRVPDRQGSLKRLAWCLTRDAWMKGRQD